jgi:exodeoxyribonuclease VII small subunit
MSSDLDAGGAAAGPPPGEMSYTEASAELDDIVRFFEQREVDVDELVGRLVRATAIIEELDKRLRRTRLQVEQLVPRLTAVLDVTGDAEGGGPSEDGGAGPAETDPRAATPTVPDAERRPGTVSTRTPELF